MWGLFPYPATWWTKSTPLGGLFDMVHPSLVMDGASTTARLREVIWLYQKKVVKNWNRPGLNVYSWLFYWRICRSNLSKPEPYHNIIDKNKYNRGHFDTISNMSAAYVVWTWLELLKTAIRGVTVIAVSNIAPNTANAIPALAMNYIRSTLFHYKKNATDDMRDEYMANYFFYRNQI